MPKLNLLAPTKLQPYLDARGPTLVIVSGRVVLWVVFLHLSGHVQTYLRKVSPWRIL